MINRKTLWISFLVLCAMIVADVWRLSLLPDWHHIPLEGPGNGHTMPMLVLFSPVLMILFTMGLIFSRKWFRSGAEDAVQPWRQWYGLLLLFNTAAAAFAETFNLARSLGGLQSINRLTLTHVIFVATGMFMMLIGNMTPKLPWLKTRFRPLDAWQWNQHLRFSGKLAFIFGLCMAVLTPLLPVKMAVRIVLALALIVVALDQWHRAKVKREPSPHS